MKKIIIISGAPATGKTTLAKELSKKYNCPWISTDLIRPWMRSLVSKEKYPNLFNFTNITAEEHYKKYTAEETIELEKLRDKDVFKGTKLFILNNENWDFFIIEGISIHPSFISELKLGDYEIYPIFLIDKDKNRIKDIVFNRGLWSKAREYEDWVKVIEQEYLIKTNDYYLSDCKKLNLPYFEIDKDRDKTTNEIIKYLDSKIKI
jgi:2-phosphoglycerate kinase